MISRSLKHISNAVTNPTNWFVAACFAVCLFSTMRLLDTRPISISQTADAAEVAADNSAHLRTNSELDAAKTLGLDSIVSSDGRHSASVKSKTVLTPIEELEVGMRVRADSPNGEFDDQFGTEVIPSKWRKLTLTSPKKNGTLSHITLLRPLDWIEHEKAVVDGQVYITVPECGIDGNARVHSIEPCPEIPDGEGQVITGTFQHQAEGGMELTIEGEPEPIRCTGNHPFWSEDRQDFVRADALEPMEQLRTSSGLRQVNSSASRTGQRSVFNIEVHGHHVYHVGESGVLIHNTLPCGPKLHRHLIRNGVDPEISRLIVRSQTAAETEISELVLEGWKKGMASKPSHVQHMVDMGLRNVAEYTNAAKALAARTNDVVVYKVGNTIYKYDTLNDYVLIVNAKSRVIKTFYDARNGFESFMQAILGGT